MMSLAHFPAERIDAMDRKQLREFITLLFIDSLLKEKDPEIDTDTLSRIPNLARKVAYWTICLHTFWNSEDELRLDAKESFARWESTGSVRPPSPV